jgi:hypothetical protein
VATGRQEDFGSSESLGSAARANMLKRSRVKNKKIETETKIIASLS